MMRFKLMLLVLLVLVITPVLAQIDCPAIVQTVLANLDTICKDTGRNEACYGNIAIAAQPRENMADFRFENIGDIESVADIQALRLSPLDTPSEAWGVAMLRLQASLPDTLPGQNVTFLLFGDVELVNAVTPENTEARPMQAFYLRTGIGDTACVEAPESGLMVQTPEGVGEVSFSVNGVDVAMGSTVFFQAQAGQEMNIKTLKGSAAIRTGGNISPVIAGTQISIPLLENLLPAGLPSLPEAYTLEEVNALPFELLGELDSILEEVEDFEIAMPLSDEQLEELHTRIQDNLSLCGEDLPFLPACDELIDTLGGEKCEVAEDGVTFICDDEDDFLWSVLDEAFDDDNPDAEGGLFFRYDAFIEQSAWAETWEDDFWEEASVDDFIEDIEEGVFRIPALDLELPELPGLPGQSSDESDDTTDETDSETDDDDTTDAEEAGDEVEEVIEELPSGCEPGICLADPAEACQCVLCGVECPADIGGEDTTGGESSDPGTSDPGVENPSEEPVTDDGAPGEEDPGAEPENPGDGGEEEPPGEEEGA